MEPESFSFVGNSANEVTSSKVLRVLTYEVGDMNKLFSKAEDYPPERNAYLGDLRGETSDACSMLRMFCELQGWSFKEVMRFGEERYLERQDDMRKHGLIG